ncbi:tubulin polyglutamylase complex subunit 2 isoform X3 [Papio anubis]|uniref:tubulin polyglutamylase complex subunit 2 isoform X3 n=1 Tax=Papio anubis TaxID=9555 RepID=UPI0004F20795|nr:tubulin polyglutamylase complex subunit 2 isoform X3 [Papio anubis]
MEEEASPPGLGCSKPHLEKLTLGITRILESSPGVTEVTIIEKPPAERHMISSWEQKNNCVMPEDVKNFYLMTNGFHMTWSVKLDASDDQPEKPHFDSRSVIFELDSCNGSGKVCLVYKSGKPALAEDTEIWFLDRALYWHFLTDTFTAYYRLLITHLGLPQWQYAFTSYGISPQAKITYNIKMNRRKCVHWKLAVESLQWELRSCVSAGMGTGHKQRGSGTKPWSCSVCSRHQSNGMGTAVLQSFLSYGKNVLFFTVRCCF